MTQATLRGALRFEGVGLHTGVRCTIDLRPADPHRGIVFVLLSPDGKTVEVPATAEHVLDTSRATVLGRNGASVSTTEHVLAALFAMGVTNAELRVEGPEVPIGDGSAAAFVRAIERIGLEAQAAPRRVLSMTEPYILSDGDKLVAVLPSTSFRVRFVADFPAPVGTEYYDGEIDPAHFRDEIAAARTFGYLHEVEALRARGLALGGSLDNALVFAEDGPMQPLRWPNEVVRHKVLDLVGDLALLGAWPGCDIVAIKSGHAMHAKLTKNLRERELVQEAMAHDV